MPVNLDFAQVVAGIDRDDRLDIDFVRNQPQFLQIPHGAKAPAYIGPLVLRLGIALATELPDFLRLFLPDVFLELREYEVIVRQWKQQADHRALHIGRVTDMLFVHPSWRNTCL